MDRQMRPGTPAPRVNEQAAIDSPSNFFRYTKAAGTLRLFARQLAQRVRSYLPSPVEHEVTHRMQKVDVVFFPGCKKSARPT
jgi:hypothetical protein